MAEWINLIHPPRANFAGTMTDAERVAWFRRWSNGFTRTA
jgi:hypothetical protein